ncbi:MAG: hypothetical protein AB7N54_08630 [Alphaproteobacteria bacterium]
MPEETLAFIVAGPHPTHKHPLRLEDIENLARSRDDVALRLVGNRSGTPSSTFVFDPTGKIRGSLLFFDGRLQTKNPDEATIVWMIELARALDARVIDNMRRTYRTPTEKYIHPDDIERRKQVARELKRVRNKWLPDGVTVMKWALVGFFILLGVAAYFVASLITS